MLPGFLHAASPSSNPNLCSIHNEFSQEAGGGGSAMDPHGLQPLGRLLETTPPVADEPIETFLVKYSRKILVTSGAVSGLGFLYFYLAGVPENRTFHFLSPFQQVVLGAATLSGMIFASLIRRAGQDFIMVDDPSGGRSEQRHGVATNAELLGGYYVPNATGAWQRFQQSANESLFPTRHVMGLLSKMFEDPAFWGSGNVIFSRYPVVSFGYASHPARTDFEIFTDKGILWADLVMGPNRRVRVLNSHMNDGGRDYNEEVRRQQALQIARMMNEAGMPAMLLADMNAVAGSPSYETLANAASGIRDGFLEAGPELAAGGPVVSFLPNNPFARLKGAKDAAHEKPGRIDHILLSGGLRAKPGKVIYEDRWKRPLEKGGTFWRTDHALLRAELILK